MQDTSRRRRFEHTVSSQGRGQGRRGLSVLRRPAHGRIRSDERENSRRLSKHLWRSIEAPNFKPASLCRPREPGAFSQHQSTGSVQAPSRQLVYPALVCFAIQMKTHKYKARLRLTERGLTLPSSGPAYGGPLKSNVRPQLQKTSRRVVATVSRLQCRLRCEQAQL